MPGTPACFWHGPHFGSPSTLSGWPGRALGRHGEATLYVLLKGRACEHRKVTRLRAVPRIALLRKRQPEFQGDMLGHHAPRIGEVSRF